MIISRDILLQIHIDLCEKAKHLMESKNSDYGATDDGLRNFRLMEQLMIPMEVGILTRMCDKMARIGKIVVSGEAVVKDETVNDTILDLINYAVILQAALNERNANNAIKENLK